MKKFFLTVAVLLILIFLSLPGCSCRDGGREGLPLLARQFKAPPPEYHPYVWWHWMGSNFSREGITKDLEAMKESGIGGATIFNLSSAVQESHVPTLNNPWPEQTFRSEAYWDAVRFAAAEAKRLGLKIGLHNTPGYATTGGPWIPEQRGMQTLVSSRTAVEGGKTVELPLDKPELPVYEGWGTTRQRATYYEDVAVMAVPEKADVNAEDILDLSGQMDAAGLLKWQAPEGRWMIYRIGHAPTMSNPHPLPDELIGKTLEVDKMSREQNRYHWQQMLTPLREHLKEYIGDSFTFIHIDSYEAGDQDWTPLFRSEFIRRKGYDPLPRIALRLHAGEREDPAPFAGDYRDVVNRLYIDSGWTVAKEAIYEAGLLFYWEPYAGPFDTYESVSLPDVPMDEFWTGGSGAIGENLVRAAGHYGKNIIAAEAFTGRPEISRYTEDPAFLKHPADGSFVSGANWLFLHHWVHQPFDDRYQPGMGMGWWGTHFGRHQTWIKPAKAFFTYLSRCQMLLQQGAFQSSAPNMIHRTTPDAEIFFVINPGTAPVDREYTFPVTQRIPELWDADRGTIRETRNWRQQDDSIRVRLKLEVDQSIFVIFPKHAGMDYGLKLPAMDITGKKTIREIKDGWNVRFEPKLDEPFRLKLDTLTDFSRHPDENVKYFSGTAIYETTIRLNTKDADANRQILLNLGEVHDIVELTVNGKEAGILWYPPYATDITPWLKNGENTLRIAVTNNWANRLIGDEQYPADFEWGSDRGAAMGRAMKGYPDWFIHRQPRPVKERKTFNVWYYYRKDDPLQPAGLIGPVVLEEAYNN